MLLLQFKELGTCCTVGTGTFITNARMLMLDAERHSYGTVCRYSTSTPRS
jgi:hypothetical protein